MQEHEHATGTFELNNKKFQIVILEQCESNNRVY
jgi:hypothetical protein